MADDEKRAFTFFRSYYEAAKELTDKQRLAFYDAIIQYGIDSEEMALSGVAKAMFALVKPTLDKSQARAAAGSKGGKSKGEANDEQTPSKPQAKPEQTASDISEDKDKDLGLRITDVDVDKDGDKDTPPLPPTGGNGAGTVAPPAPPPFDQFWSAYPKKVGKEAARKAWNKIKPSAALLRKILDAIESAKQSEQWQREKGRYIPNPATWLNQGRWDDELTPGGGDDGGKTSNAGGGYGKPAAPREDWSSFKPSTGFKRSSPDGE
ncbi:DUF6291 domain-containing protein [Desulfitobacterium sp.]|uniref:DUF6291 domain-containing protein n=1 Tax=Desulfitobacterium sp. TaxID=49981 RepID=UPI002B211A19|nr:DUF6291 domain-containing protein [Desulfitobacterium sp.]MEA4901887.1 DUF6291 domain-containing protein [Desulfitobacterium sp.]